jgi:hypothetical protein
MAESSFRTFETSCNLKVGDEQNDARRTCAVRLTRALRTPQSLPEMGSYPLEPLFVCLPVLNFNFVSAKINHLLHESKAQFPGPISGFQRCRTSRWFRLGWFRRIGPAHK